MIYNPEVAFIHVPKTGGMSMTRFLVNALDGPVTVVAPANAYEHSLALAETPQAAAKVMHVNGRRHETCPQAIELMEAQKWRKPPCAFAMIRHPVDLMLSYYKHMRKPHIWKLRGLSRETLRGPPKTAMEETFDDFCRQELFYCMSDETLLDYYRSSMFDRFDIVPLNDIIEYVELRFSHHAAYAAGKLGHYNRSREKLFVDDISDATVRYIIATYPGLTTLYEKTIVDGSWRQT